MRKHLAFLLCICLLAGLLAGCSAAPGEQSLPAETVGPTVEPTPASTPEPTPEPTPESTPEPTPEPFRYVFQPKVCPSYMEEIFGAPMVETWFSLVDAVLAGEDTFSCPDAETYFWVMGQFPGRCFPVLLELIDYCYDRDHPVQDGVASFTYKVPPEVAAARIGEFAALVEEILNDALEENDSELEKALALYLYFCHHYSYDYEAAHAEGEVDYLSSYRLLTQGKGICQDISTAYSYILLEAGLDATVMAGTRATDGADHQWSYVRIHGHNFHIDPTYGVGNNDWLGYFMMTTSSGSRWTTTPKKTSSFAPPTRRIIPTRTIRPMTTAFGTSGAAVFWSWTRKTSCCSSPGRTPWGRRTAEALTTADGE